MILSFSHKPLLMYLIVIDKKVKFLNKLIKLSNFGFDNSSLTMYQHMKLIQLNLINNEAHDKAPPDPTVHLPFS